jgi:GntR family transcriptional repressor for pyruvate dehydrogenase complex
MAPRPDTADEPPKALRFGTLVRRQRLADQVADSILAAIVEQDLKPGDPLPSQGELGEQFGVSRTVIREAVGSLAARGVIEVRSGSGLRLASADPSAVAESMRYFVRSSEALDYAKVHEVRTMVETHMAERAAERATPENIEEMRRLCDEMEESGDDLEAAAERDLEFHRSIATAAHNELYLVLLDSIRGALLDIRRSLMPGRLRKTVRAHRKIIDAIAAGDVPAAGAAMQEHLDTVERDWRAERS